MFREVFFFEIRTRLRRISTHLYFGIFFTLSLVIILAYGGVFQHLKAGFGGAGGNILANSPFVTFMSISALALFGLPVVAAIMGGAACRDFQHNAFPLFFTTPVAKWSYLGGRYFGGLVVLLYVFSSLLLGCLVATWLPLIPADKLGPVTLDAYLRPFLFSVLPNLMITGAAFFGLALLSRRILPAYTAGVIALIGYMIAGQFMTDIESQTLASIIDPFGFTATELLTRYWTVAEKNTLAVPLSGVFLANRLLWLGVGGVVLALTWSRFRFAQFTSERRGRPAAAEEIPVAPERTFSLPPDLPAAGPRAALAQWWALSRLEFKGILKSVYFLVLVLAGVLFIFATADAIGQMFGTSTYPVTYKVLEITGGTFALFVLIIITLYAGELVWRDRDMASQQLVDTLPVSDGTLYLAKLIALVLTEMVLLGVVMACGILIQLSQGYTRLELGQYLSGLFVFQLADYALIAVLALLVHTLVNHKYLGHLVMVLYYLVRAFMGQFGWEHNLYRYASDAGLTYSDMNGYGHFLAPWVWFKLYWAAFAALLAILTLLFWVRGMESGWPVRLKLARQRFTRRTALAAAGVGVVFVALGGFIFYNTNILNTYRSSFEWEALQARYERQYKKLEHLLQPRVTDVRVEVDLYPSERRLQARGHFLLRNKGIAPVPVVYVNLPARMEIRRLRLDGVSKRELDDAELGCYAFRLPRPLPPGGTARLEFDLAWAARGFTNESSASLMTHNGTFINNFEFLPGLGYNAGRELDEDETRQKHGLAKRPGLPAPGDRRGRMNNYISSDADWVGFEAIVSTSPDQIALAPGYLQREWTHGNRRYFHYRMDAPILNFYAFLSARYRVLRDRWRDVAIEIYYQPGHEYNLRRMVKAIQKSLDYYTTHFSPYQHRQVRILEFPRYASFAQSFPNTIPYSEAIGFIARVDPDDEKDIDYPFYVTAHEVAHQWWAHQVIGGAVQGATLMSESLSQYSALMVMEREFGQAKMQRFLRYELDRYLSSRSMERRKESPLARVEEQGYIYYNKGSLVMYALRDYLGEDRLNAVLAAYIKTVGFQEPPYTNSAEFLQALRAATPAEHQDLVTDLFERITMFENHAVRATATPLEGGRYKLRLTVRARKLRADELGNETAVPLGDWIDVGALDEKGREIYLRKERLTAPETTLEISLDRRPAKAGIDIRNKLIDRHPEDNLISVEIAPAR